MKKLILILLTIIALGAGLFWLFYPSNFEPSNEVIPITPTGNERYVTLDSDYIFDQTTLHTFELTIPQPALEKLDADPAAEEYVEASLTFNGETVSPIGVRYKGSIGAFVDCLSGRTWWEPSGHKTCTKLSMKAKLNWTEPDNTFYGLKKLQFHSQNLDDTQMHERLGYWLFREMGVRAPRSVHARLVINGTYSGLYALTEQIDGRFTRHNFDEGGGNLYKEIWPLDEQGQPHHKNEYLEQLKTNEDEEPTDKWIRTFAQEVADADPEMLQNVIAKWMNIDEILAYAVVDRTIRNDDGAFHWYCDEDEGGCESHNFYWYEEPIPDDETATLHLIPWDLDNAFENIVRDSNPVTPIADAWGQISADCEPFPYGRFRLPQRSAACDKLTGGWATFTQEHERIQAAFMAGPFSAEQINALLDSWEVQIRDATVEAAEAHEDALSITKWEAAVNKLRQDLEYAREQGRE